MERTRRALREGLVSLLRRKPVDKITSQDLAVEARVGYASFFRHYSSKEELLEEVVKEQVGQLMDATVPILDARNTRAACLALCGHVEQNRTIWIVLIRHAAGMLREEFITLAMARRSPKLAPPSSRLAIEVGSHIGVAATIELLGWWLQRKKPMSVTEVASILDNMIVAPALRSL